MRQRFVPIIDIYRHYVRRTIGYTGWNWLVTQAMVPLPWLIQAPRLFAGKIGLGGVAQTAAAFGTIQDSLSFFRNHYSQFASFRASIIRLHGLVDANARARELPEVAVEPSERGSVEIAAVEVRTPSGEQLIDPLEVRLNSGDALVVIGRSGAGKTTLLRSLAQLWPYASGTLRRPAGEHATMFLSQLPYVPLGDLRGVVCYPNSADHVSDAAAREALTKVGSPRWPPGSMRSAIGPGALSGEQQRIAFARVLLAKPQAVFLDEATSALDEGLEFALYQLLRTELPECVVVSVSHRRTVEQHHDHLLELLGAGKWELRRIGRETANV